MRSSNFGKNIKHEEKVLLNEFKKEEKALSWFARSLTLRLILILILFSAIIYGIFYLAESQNRVYIDKSEISAPIISLSSSSSGVLEKVFVEEGQIIPADMPVAQVNGALIKSKVSGMIIFVQNTPGQMVSSQNPIVKMIELNELRVVGHLEENKGLNEIVVGQKVTFTVDAFGSKKYFGVVDSVSPTSRDSAIAFSISSKRPQKEFDVKAKFDVIAYPELRNGMSAKMVVFK